MDNVNIFEYNKDWFEYVAENIHAKPIHTCLYFSILNKWNLLFWKDQFGLPTEITMQSLNIKSYKTYINVLNDLIDFGFIKIIERSKNQYSSNIIEVVKNTKAHTKAHTKALLKHTPKQVQSTHQSIDSIIKQINNKQITIEQLTIKQIESLNIFLNGKDNNKDKIEKREKDFLLSLEQYIDKYGKVMIDNFYNYWSEHDKKEDKMRFENERTWQTSKRLVTWSNNNFNNKGKEIKQEPKKLKLNEIDDNIHYWVKFKGIQKYKNIGFGIKKEATDNELEYIETI